MTSSILLYSSTLVPAGLLQAGVKCRHKANCADETHHSVNELIN